LDVKIEKVRVDKWLWWARFYKTRSLSAKKISSGVVRLNSRSVRKPSAEITIDDVLTLKHGEIIRVIKVISLEEGRKNYDKAKKMYEDIEHIK
jgi:ribosome-associated heat shock protein Hsp15